MDFEGRVLSNKKVVEAVTAACIPVVADNPRQVKQAPRNPELFDLCEPWGGLVWILSPDRKFRAAIDYSKTGTVAEFLKAFDVACAKLEAQVQAAGKQ